MRKVMRLESKKMLQTVIPRVLVFVVLGHLATQTLRAAPSIVSVTPNNGQQGQTLAEMGAGRAVNRLTVNRASKATANNTVQNSAKIGGRTVTVTTGTQVVSKTNAFTVKVPPASITSVTPNSGQQGQTLASVA